MKDSKHTLTPWEMDDVDGCASITTDRSADICTEICYLSGLADLDQNAANGRFIVLACNCHDDLLAALKNLCQELREYNPTDIDLTAADAAIAKAEAKP